jgi:hypothetical protein
VLLFADIWWFNGKSTVEPPPSTRPWRRFDPGHVYQAMSVMLANWERIGLLLPPAPDRLGLLGIMDNQGFDQYGSFYYVSIATGQRTARDFRLADTEQRIRKGADRFEHAAKADTAAVERFLQQLQRLQATGIHVVLIFPPLAGRVNDLMTHVGGYEYVPDLLRRLSDRGAEPLDYRDLRSLERGVSDPDCELVDGLHGGDVAYARLIRDAANRDPILQATVDVQALDAFVLANSGTAQGARKFFRNAREVDFLGLGCERSESSWHAP